MPFRVLTIGDVHYKVSNSFETDLMVKAIQSELRANRYDFTVILGDILDKFGVIYINPLNRAMAFLDAVRRLSKHTYILIGNHDRANNNVFLTEEHPFTALKYWSDFTVVDTVLIKDIVSEDGDKAQFVFVPYVSPGRLREALKTAGLDLPSSNPNTPKEEKDSSFRTEEPVTLHISEKDSSLDLGESNQRSSKEKSVSRRRSISPPIRNHCTPETERNKNKIKVIKRGSKEPVKTSPNSVLTTDSEVVVIESEAVLTTRSKEPLIKTSSKKEAPSKKESNKVATKDEVEPLNEAGWLKLLESCCVFAHQEFFGAKLGIKTSVEGDVWPLEAPYCISGHIHDYCHLQPNLWYVGTPIQHGIADVGEKTISAFTFTPSFLPQVSSEGEEKASSLNGDKEKFSLLSKEKTPFSLTGEEILSSPYENKEENLSPSENKEKVSCKTIQWLAEERRINLGVPRKIRITIYPDELILFKIPENASSIRLDLEVDPIEYTRLLKTPHVISLIKAGVQIKPITTRQKLTKDSLPRVGNRVSYARRLESAIKKENEDVRRNYAALFGPLSNTPVRTKIRILSK
jgi:hypothetical protein